MRAEHLPTPLRARCLPLLLGNHRKSVWTGGCQATCMVPLPTSSPHYLYLSVFQTVSYSTPVSHLIAVLSFMKHCVKLSNDNVHAIRFYWIKQPSWEELSWEEHSDLYWKLWEILFFSWWRTEHSRDASTQVCESSGSTWKYCTAQKDWQLMIKILWNKTLRGTVITTGAKTRSCQSTITLALSWVSGLPGVWISLGGCLLCWLCASSWDDAFL